jgi:hypothetical protein
LEPGERLFQFATCVNGSYTISIKTDDDDSTACTGMHAVLHFTNLNHRAGPRGKIALRSNNHPGRC